MQFLGLKLKKSKSLFLCFSKTDTGAISNPQEYDDSDVPYIPKGRPRKGGNMSPGVYKGKNRTYAELIACAILSAESKRMTLNQIYNWMMK